MAYIPICKSSDRAAWLNARRAGIGSSDAAAILGVSPFASALSVYVDKIGEALDREASEAMKWGSILEPLIIEEFAKETGRVAHAHGMLLANVSRPWQIATLDAVQRRGPDILDGGVLEIKATGHRVGDWDEGIPPHVMVQVQHQLAVTDLAWGSVAVLQRGCALKWADFERDDRFIDEVLIPTEAEFWRRVEAREPVDPDGSEASRKALKALYPRDSGEIVSLPGDLIELDDERVTLKQSVKDAEKRIEIIDQRIVSALGDASEGVLANGVIYTHRTQSRKEYVVKAQEFRVLRRKAS